LTAAPSKGISRITWNLRGEATNQISMNNGNNKNNGFLVPPGNYSIEAYLIHNGTATLVAEKTPFIVKALNNQTLVAKNPEALAAFRNELAELNRKVNGASALLGETKDKISLYEQAIKHYPSTDLNLLNEIKQLYLSHDRCALALYGDGIKTAREVETEPSIMSRLSLVEYMLNDNTTDATKSQIANKAIAEEAYNEMRSQLNDLIIRTKKIEVQLDNLHIPYIQGKDQNWKKN
jgi:hypothetical protein